MRSLPRRPSRDSGHVEARRGSGTDQQLDRDHLGAGVPLGERLPAAAARTISSGYTPTPQACCAGAGAAPSVSLGDRARDESAEAGIDAVGVLACAVRSPLDDFARDIRSRASSVSETVRPDGDRPNVRQREVVARQRLARSRRECIPRPARAPGPAATLEQAQPSTLSVEAVDPERRTRCGDRGSRASGRRVRTSPPRPAPAARSRATTSCSAARSLDVHAHLTSCPRQLEPERPTPGKPPSRSRTSAAISSPLRAAPRFTLKAIKGLRARDDSLARSSSSPARSRASCRRSAAAAPPARRRERRPARGHRRAAVEEDRCRARPHRSASRSAARGPRQVLRRAGRAEPRRRRRSGVRAVLAPQIDAVTRARIPASNAAVSSSSEPTSVKTERLWSSSACTSRRRARDPSASASASIVARSRPSEKFGTDSSGRATCVV